MGLALAGAMLFGVGASVAGVFACAAAAADEGAAPGSLYGADLAGGALGSLAAGLILVPIAGLVPTTWLVVGLSALALLLV
jgi:predicted lipid-binding transport protein (Tim44 family)